MVKRFLICLLLVAMVLLLGGCWNYKGLDQLNIVLGIAVDFDKEANQFNITYEVADQASAGKNTMIKSRIVKSQGKTLLDAARNAKRKEADKLFFGSTNILVLSRDIALEMGIQPVIDWFLRDGECRETMHVALSQEDTAEAILQRSGQMSGIVSINLHDILRKDRSIVASTRNVKLYELYDILELRNSAVLPAIHKAEENADQQIAELNGIAILQGDRLKGFLTPDESKYLLFLENIIKSGVLTLSAKSEKTDDISLEIFDNKTKKSFAYNQDKIVVKFETRTHVVIDENHSKLDMMDPEVIKQIEKAGEEMLEKNLRDLISKIQQEFQTDIFGFGEMIHKKDLKLWKQLEPSWKEIYPTLEVDVKSKLIIRDSAFIK